MPDEIETILRLVAEGKLSADEAAPIIDALSRPRAAASPHDEEPPFAAGAPPGREARRAARQAQRDARSMARDLRRNLRDETRAMRDAYRRQLRIRVTEGGRQVVNLRIPLAMAEMAGGMVPGIAQHMERIQEAIDANLTGPIIDIEDEDGDGVLITVE